MKIETNYVWNNTINKVTAHPKKFFSPESISDLQNIVREAEQKGLRVRAVGSGHSYSEVAKTNDYLVGPDCMEQYQILDHQRLKPSVDMQRKFVEVGSGIRIEKLNRLLTNDNLALENMGAIDEQRIAGAVSTNTHGSGIRLPTIAGLVRSILLVTGEGRTIRVEPSDGITSTDFSDPGIELIQNDDYFYSILVSFGSMGIIYSLILEVQDLYYLMESKTLTIWDNVKEKLRSGEYFNPDIRSVTLLISPYKLNKDNPGKQSCIEVIQKKIDEPKPGNWTYNMLFRNLPSWLVGNFPIPIAYWFIKNKIEKHPEKTPQLIESSLRSIRDKIFVDISHKVLFQGYKPLKKRAYDCAFAFPVDADCKYIDIMEEVMAITQQYAEGVDGKKYYQTSPNSFRFITGSKAFLAHNYGDQPYVVMDFPFFMIQPGADELLEKYQKLLLERGGRPHWGKKNDVLLQKIQEDPNFLKELYPMLPRWRNIFFELNPKGTFINEFTQQTGLTTPSV